MNKGTIVPSDDLEVNQFYTVFGLKDGRLVQTGGFPFQIMAIDLPFIVIKFLDQSPPAPLDTRMFDLKRVSEEYVTAYRKANPTNPLAAFFGNNNQVA